ncbi:DUF6916 family protein [Undibacterium fentianense]|uniref:DUF6916 domain-containing protein n=1 Tax=Undibacterium fentianense TaxID=2828728 RepID=A0A941E469_9BURK|nr:hypothetical protein [Undibacterium fentianense]MBR7800711.1 hypothetical protein [Undibacterium fentianense]
MSISFTQAVQSLHTSFIAHTSAGTVELRLIEAKELNNRNMGANGFRTPMILVFSAPQSPALAQDNYYLDHAQLGRHFLSLTPALPPLEQPQTIDRSPLQFYQAIFN